MKQDMTVDSMTVKGYLAVTCRDADFDSGNMNIQLDSDTFRLASTLVSPLRPTQD